MMNQPTMEMLYAMRLGAMAAAWQQQATDPKVGALDFDERFGLLVSAEHLARDNRRLTRLLKNAELRLSHACLEDMDVIGVTRAFARELGMCAWVDQHLHVLITGMTGVGKSFMACALGQAACRRGLTALYRRVPRLFHELTLAKADGSYPKLLRKLARADVLILDDLGLGTLTDAQRHDLLEICEDRYGVRSTVVTSQLDIKHWHEWIGEPTLADAILDRLVHNAYKVELKGKSKRKTAEEATH